MSTDLEVLRGRLSWHGTAVMGIVNTTPDSFSDGGRHMSRDDAVAAGVAMFEAGALIVDVGGESTRPGSEPVGAAEQLRRVLPVISGLADNGVPTSIDTALPEVARAALEAGAWLVNDIGGLRDPAMLEVVAEAGAGAVALHMQGEPRTMQHDPAYGDVVSEVTDWLAAAGARAGVYGIDAVMLDPGIGFGKNLEHNLELLRQLPALCDRGWPVLVGASRKGLIGTLSGVHDPAARDPGSIALHLFAARMGASMVRVHDVPGHVQALSVQAGLAGDA